MTRSDDFRPSGRAADAAEPPGQAEGESSRNGPPEGVFSEAGAGGTAAQAEELEALRDRYLRLAAEYDNFRKRTDRERVEARDRAQGQLVETLLEPLDDLQRVAQFSAENTTLEALIEGVRMVERKVVRALGNAGLETMEAQGERFDPELHEALMTVATDEASEDETVGEVLQRGYRFRGMLLRPARVQVRKHDG